MRKREYVAILVIGVIFVAMGLIYGITTYYENQRLEEVEATIQLSNCHLGTKTERYKSNGKDKTRKVNATFCDRQYSYTYKGHDYSYVEKSVEDSGAERRVGKRLVDPESPDKLVNNTSYLVFSIICLVFGCMMSIAGIVQLKKGR